MFEALQNDVAGCFKLQGEHHTTLQSQKQRKSFELKQLNCENVKLSTLVPTIALLKLILSWIQRKKFTALKILDLTLKRLQK
eukprot:snap_masked-scaffold_6-processed-gene-2.32-mRNA-1 protein AED:0.66 eAED:1.00 QI:0/0/0/0.5/1/1/2/0/81